MANRNFMNKGNMFTMHAAPVLLDCNFIVDSANGNGLGLRSLKGPLIANVYMHTSSTPAVGNPNPAAGVIVVQLQDNYNRYLSGFSGFISPIATPAATVVSGSAYVLTSAGTATAAQLQAAGIPLANIQSAQLTTAGLASLVGIAFVAIESATIGGSATAALSTASGIDHIEGIGNPNLAFLASVQGGGLLVFQCLAAGVLTAPADGTVISLAFLLNNSSVQVQGE